MERMKFEFIPPHVLEIARKEEHAKYFRDVGLANFVSQVPWSENVEHSKANMFELIQNFDSSLVESRVNSMVISLTTDSVRNMFRLEDGGHRGVKNQNYSPKSFSSNDRGKVNRAYRLQSCKNDLVKERLEFQLTTLHMKGKRAETDIALYEIQIVEESMHADWSLMLASKLVKKISKAKESLLQSNAKVVCDIASHLQVILYMSRTPSYCTELVFPLTTQTKLKQPMEEKQEEGKIHCERDTDMNSPQRNSEQATLHPTSEQPDGNEPVEQELCCKRQCMEMAEELNKEYALMTEANATMTAAFEELRMELGRLRAAYKEVYDNLIKDKGESMMHVSLSKDIDSGNVIVIDPTPPSDAEKTNIKTLPVGIEDKESFMKNFKKQATDSQEIKESLSSKDNGARLTNRVSNMKEKTPSENKGTISYVASTASKTQVVGKRLKLQQKKLCLQPVIGATEKSQSTEKPQSVKRQLDMDMNLEAEFLRLSQKRCRRARRLWSKEETDYLIAAVSRFGEKWAMISEAGKAILVDRNGGDFKDKWRNMNVGE